MSRETKNETNTEPNKPIEARELTDKELEGIVGGLSDVPEQPQPGELSMPMLQAKLKPPHVTC